MHRNGDRPTGVKPPGWLRERSGRRELDHDDLIDPDELADRCRAAWWGGLLWGVTATGLAASALWAARLI